MNYQYDSIPVNNNTFKNFEFLSKISILNSIEGITARDGRLYSIQGNQTSKNVNNVFSNIQNRENGKYFNLFIPINNTLKDINSNLIKTPHLHPNSIKKIENVINATRQIVDIFNKSNQNCLEDEEETKIAHMIETNILEMEFFIQRIKEETSLDWVKENCMELFEIMKNCDQMLIDSEHPDVPLQKRMERSPIPISAGASGSYFLQSLQPENKVEVIYEQFNTITYGEYHIHEDYKGIQANESNRDSRKILKKNVIAKPAQQEFMVTYPGFQVGTNIIRERLGYYVQKLLDLDCGVPPTVITTLTHSMFEKEDPLDAQLEKLAVPITRKKFVELTENGTNIDSFWDHLIEYQNGWIDQKISNLSDELKNEINSYVDSKIELNNKIKHINEATNYTFTRIREIRALGKEAVTQLAYHIMQELIACKQTKPAVVSCQYMMENCISLDNLQKEEFKKICPKECEKFIIDLILFNADRHLGNILARPMSQDQIFKRIKSYAPFLQNESERKLFNATIANSLIEKLDLNSITRLMIAYLKSKEISLQISDALEKTIENYVFALSNGYESVYEIFLIDHGNCLPDPDAKDSTFSSLEFSLHQWATELDQTEQTSFTGFSKEKILALDIAHFVKEIGSEILAHFVQFGENCSVPKACMDLLHLNLLFLQKGVKKNLSLQKLNVFFSKHLISDIYPLINSEAHNINERIKWENIANEIDLLLKNNKDLQQ